MEGGGIGGWGDYLGDLGDLDLGSGRRWGLETEARSWRLSPPQRPH